MMKRMMLICLLLSMFYVADAKDLRFNRAGEFKIVQFTDLHWKPNVPANQVGGSCMEKVLDAEKPDLVVLTGDIITGKPVKQGLDELLVSNLYCIVKAIWMEVLIKTV